MQLPVLQFVSAYFDASDEWNIYVRSFVTTMLPESPVAGSDGYPFEYQPSVPFIQS